MMLISAGLVVEEYKVKIQKIVLRILGTVYLSFQRELRLKR